MLGTGMHESLLAPSVLQSLILIQAHVVIMPRDISAVAVVFCFGQVVVL